MLNWDLLPAPEEGTLKDQAGDGADSGGGDMATHVLRSPPSHSSFERLPLQLKKRKDRSNMFIQKEYSHQVIHMNAHACT